MPSHICQATFGDATSPDVDLAMNGPPVGARPKFAPTNDGGGGVAWPSLGLVGLRSESQRRVRGCGDKDGGGQDPG